MTTMSATELIADFDRQVALRDRNRRQRSAHQGLLLSAGAGRILRVVGLGVAAGILLSVGAFFLI